MVAVCGCTESPDVRAGVQPSWYKSESGVGVGGQGGQATCWPYQSESG